MYSLFDFISFERDQVAVYPTRREKDLGAPQGDPRKFVARQKVLIEGRVDQISRGRFADLLVPRTWVASLDCDTVRELELTRGSSDCKEYFGDRIDRTQTVLGHTFFLLRLLSPTTDIKLLNKRQGVIKTLKANTILQGAIKQCLSNMKKEEGSLISCWEKMQVPNCVGRFGFKTLPGRLNGFCNTSPPLVELGAQWENGTSWLKFATRAMAGAALAVYGSGIMGDSSAVDQFAQRHSGTTNPLSPWIFSLPPSLQSIPAIGMGLSVLSTVPQAYQWLRADQEVVEMYMNKMRGVASFFESAKDIYTEVQNYAGFINGLEHFKELVNLFTDKDPQLQSFFQALQGLGSKAGHCKKHLWHPFLIAIQSLQDKAIRDKLEKGFIALAEIDALMSCVSLLQSPNEPPYSFSEYTEKPMNMEIEDLHNPQVRKKPILNSLKYSNKECKTVLTGPNGGGKSTLLRAALSAVIMAQTFGIAPCQSCTVAPFDEISCALKTEENAAEGLSHFQSQVKKATWFIEKAEKNPAKSFLFVMDEPFSGARAEDAEQFTNSLLKRLADLKNCICIIATHETIQEKDCSGWKFAQMAHDEQGNPLYKMGEGLFSNSGLAAIAARAVNGDPQLIAGLT